MEKRIPPMLLSKVNRLEQDPSKVYEPKWDGYRVGVYRELGRISIITRAGNDFTDRFPGIVEQVPDFLGENDAVIDGEIVAFDQQGHHNIYTMRRKNVAHVLFAFDLLRLNGNPLIYRSWEERRSTLEDCTAEQPNIQLTPYFDDAEAVVAAARELNLEGVVAKNRRSIYKPGSRSQDWQKLKFRNLTEHWNRHKR